MKRLGWVCVLVVVVVAAWAVVSRWQARQPVQAGSGSTAEVSSATPPAGKTAEGKPSRPPGNYDEALPIPPDANPSVKSVVEAAKTGEHPERLTPLLKPKPFSLAAFEADPEGYCQLVVPGRVWQTATPGPAVKALQAKGVALLTAGRGEKVRLTIRGEPKAPTTFTSFETGEFPNRLTSITVRADENGEASTQFQIVPGTPDTVHVLVASPLCVGQVEFRIRVK
jgi:hypothetical protein